MTTEHLPLRLLFSLAMVLSALQSVTSEVKYDFPVFKKWEGSTENTKIIDLEETEKWGAGFPTAYKIILNGRSPISMTMSCAIYPLSENSKLTSINYCFKPRDGNGSPNCQSLSGSNSGTMYVGGARVSLTFNKYTGGRASFDKVSSSADISSIFSCELTNPRGSITSNTITFYDNRKLFTNSYGKKDNKDMTIPADGKYTVECGSGFMQPSGGATLKFVWKYSSSSVTTACINGQELEAANNWPRQILSNGALFYPFLTETMRSNLDNQHLCCVVGAQLAVFYTKPISFTSTGETVTALKITYPPPGETPSITIMDSKVIERKLYCNFEVGKGAFQVKWKKTTESGKDAEIYDKAVWQEADNGLMFSGAYGFSSTTPGTYKCIITWTPEGQTETSTASASYSVKIEYFPKASSPPLIYVPDGDDGRANCNYTNPFPDLPESQYWITPSLEINGMALQIESEAVLKKSIEGVNAKFRSYMSPLQVAVSPLNPKKNVNVTYVAKKMVFRNVGSGLSSSHTVTCVGTNAIGNVRTKTVLQVVPKPDIPKGGQPADTKCPCSPLKEHVFKCMVTNQYFYGNSTYGNSVVFKRSWKLGDQYLTTVDDTSTDVFKHFNVSDDLSELTLSTGYDEDIRQKINMLQNLTCIITLAYPSNTKEKDIPTRVPKTGVYKYVFFNSLNYPEYQEMLVTKINLNEIPKTAEARNRKASGNISMQRIRRLQIKALEMQRKSLEMQIKASRQLLELARR